MKYNTESRKAVESLRPLLIEGLERAQEKQKHAEEMLKEDNQRLLYGKVLDNIEPVRDNTIVIQFMRSIPNHFDLTKPNIVLDAFLYSLKRNELKGGNAQKVFGAIIAMMKGLVPTGLCTFTKDCWITRSASELMRLVELSTPEKLSDIKQLQSQASIDFVSATYELGRLTKMLQALATLEQETFKATPKTKITNTTNRNLSVMNIDFPADETISIERESLARLGQHLGFRNNIKQGSFVVIQ